MIVHRIMEANVDVKLFDRARSFLPELLADAAKARSGAPAKAKDEPTADPAVLLRLSQEAKDHLARAAAMASERSLGRPILDRRSASAEPPPMSLMRVDNPGDIDVIGKKDRDPYDEWWETGGTPPGYRGDGPIGGSSGGGGGGYGPLLAGLDGHEGAECATKDIRDNIDGQATNNTKEHVGIVFRGGGGKYYSSPDSPAKPDR